MSKERAANTNISLYRILAKIGAGGMGEVYPAEDTIRLQKHTPRSDFIFSIMNGIGRVGKGISPRYRTQTDQVSQDASNDLRRMRLPH